MPVPLRFKREAARELAALPPEVQERFFLAFSELARAPTRYAPAVRIKQMRGRPGFWRLSVGPWRGVYRFDGEAVVFYIFGHRKLVYTQFEPRSRA